MGEIVLHEDSSEDESDSEFELYDCGEDGRKTDADRPAYVRQCLSHLMETNDGAQLQLALQTLPSLIELHKSQCEEILLELVAVLLNYNSTFNIDNFEELQLKCLISLCEVFPVMTADYLCKEFYQRNYTMKQRSLILKTIEATAKKLSQIERFQTKVCEELSISSEENEEENDSFSSIIRQRLKLKTKFRREIHCQKRILLKRNDFGDVVRHFFYPLMTLIDKSTSHLSLISNADDRWLLCELVSCLSRLCVYGQNTLAQSRMVKDLWQLLKSLEKHEDAGVRHVVIYGYASCLVLLSEGDKFDDALQTDLMELKQHLDYLIGSDPNSELHKLARLTRQILLKILKEKSEKFDCFPLAFQ